MDNAKRQAKRHCDTHACHLTFCRQHMAPAGCTHVRARSTIRARKPAGNPPRVWTSGLAIFACRGRMFGPGHTNGPNMALFWRPCGGACWSPSARAFSCASLL